MARRCEVNILAWTGARCTQQSHYRPFQTVQAVLNKAIVARLVQTLCSNTTESRPKQPSKRMRADQCEEAKCTLRRTPFSQAKIIQPTLQVIVQSTHLSSHRHSSHHQNHHHLNLDLDARLPRPIPPLGLLDVKITLRSTLRKTLRKIVHTLTRVSPMAREPPGVGSPLTHIYGGIFCVKFVLKFGVVIAIIMPMISEGLRRRTKRATRLRLARDRALRYAIECVSCAHKVFTARGRIEWQMVATRRPWKPVDFARVS